MSDRTSIANRDGRPFVPIAGGFLPVYRHWFTIAIIAGADVLAFVVAALLFRVGRVIPEIVSFRAGTVEHTPIDIFFILGFLFIVVRYISGDYSRRHLFWDGARATTLGVAVTSIPCLIILAAFPGRYSAFAEIGSWTFLLFAIPLARQLARIALGRAGLWQLPTALIASGPRANEICTAMNETISLGYDIRWLAQEDYDGESLNSMRQVKRLALTNPADTAAKLARDGCEQAVVATEDMQSPLFADLIRHLMEAGIAVSFIPSFRRLPLAGITTSYFFGRDILLFQVRRGMQRLPQRFVKRLFDIVGSLALLILFSPVFVITALAIRWHDGGPIFYGQKRVGRRGEPFRCLKFRTMAVDADERLYRWRVENPDLHEQFLKTYKLIDDPRVTEPGKWLRKTSLDELPQLVNVLRGEMSLVGPRPVVERELIEFYGSAAQLYKSVRPGLTGLWQISGRSDTTYEKRIIYDEWYILNWSLWYDIVIALQTAWIVISGKGAY